MQDKNQTKVKKILLALANHADVRGIRGLARFLNLNDSVLYAWINRDKIGDLGSILLKFPGISHEWLETGLGEMFSQEKFRQFAETRKGEESDHPHAGSDKEAALRYFEAAGVNSLVAEKVLNELGKLDESDQFKEAGQIIKDIAELIGGEKEKAGS